METYDGMRAIGFGIILSIFGTIIIHTFMSYPTQESWIPDPSLPIYIKNIHRCKHGSDSEVYNHRGRYNFAFDDRKCQRRKIGFAFWIKWRLFKIFVSNIFL